MSPTLENMIKAAKAGGAILKKYYGQNLETIEKTSARDFCTRADVESEEAITEILSGAFPSYNILAEEKSSVDKNSEYTFAIDPMDGTNNFVLGIPNFTVSIGLYKGDKVVAGVIYVPIIDHIYYAEEGNGSYCNGLKIEVNPEKEITRSTICTVYSYGTTYENVSAIDDGIENFNVKRITRNWSPAFDFCMLASGKVEAIVNYNSEIHDFAAGRIIAREAGAVFANFDGSMEKNDKNRIFVASNNTEIQKFLVSVVKDRQIMI